MPIFFIVLAALVGLGLVIWAIRIFRDEDKESKNTTSARTRTKIQPRKIVGYITAAISSFAVLLACIIAPALVLGTKTPFGGLFGAMIGLALVRYTWKRVLILFVPTSSKAKTDKESHTASDFSYANSTQGETEFTLYSILEVDETASPEELKVAYRKKALVYHPDINGGSESSHLEFVAVKRAYEVLSNSGTRCAYDMKLVERRKTYSTNPPKYKPQPKQGNYQPQKQNNNTGSAPAIWILGVFFVALIAFIVHCYNSEDTDQSDATPKQMSQTVIEPDKPEAVTRTNTKMLNNGDTPYEHFYGEGNFDKKSLSTIKVCNGNESCVVVVLTDAVSGAYCRHAYIKKGWYYKMEGIPNGLYDLKVYYGNGWNKLKTNGSNKPVGGFDYDESFSHLSNSDYISIRQRDLKDRTLYSEHTITLYKVEDGNLRTKDLSKEKFF